MKQDIRWEQRFSNYIKAVNKLQQSVAYILQDLEAREAHLDDVLTEMLREGLIQRFEYTHELAWNVMKDYAEDQGNANVGGSKDATREAFALKLIADGRVWMDMIGSRNQKSHTYNEETANEIYEKIISDYYPAFILFKNTMEEKRSGQQENLF